MSKEFRAEDGWVGAEEAYNFTKFPTYSHALVHIRAENETVTAQKFTLYAGDRTLIGWSIKGGGSVDHCRVDYFKPIS